MWPFQFRYQCLVIVFLALWDGFQESCSYRRVQEWFSSPPVAPPALPPAASLKLILAKLRASQHKSGSRFSFFTFTFISFGMIFAIKISKLTVDYIFVSAKQQGTGHAKNILNSQFKKVTCFCCIVL